MDPVKLRAAKEKVGNTFALTVLLQKRCQELVSGAKPLVDERFKSPIDTALEEVVQGKIWLGTIAEEAPASAPAPAAAATT